MYWKCSVPNCNSRRQDVKLHVFPSCRERSKKWLESINCDNLRGLCFTKLFRRFVCHKHFEKRFLTSKKNLHCVAYPTLFTDEEISCGIPSKQCEETENNNVQEHNYSSKRRHSDHSYAKPMPLASNEKNVDIPNSTLSDFILQHCCSSLQCTDDTSALSNIDQNRDSPMWQVSLKLCEPTLVPSCSSSESQQPMDSLQCTDDTLEPSCSSPESQPMDPLQCTGTRRGSETGLFGPTASSNSPLTLITPLPFPYLPPTFDVNSELSPPNCADATLQNSLHVKLEPSCSSPESQQAMDPLQCTEITPALLSNEQNLESAEQQLSPKLSVAQKTKRTRICVLNDSTPGFQNLYKKYKNCKRQLSYACRAKEALKYSKEENFEKMTKNMSAIGKKIFWMQVKQSTKKEKGRRFSLEEKIIALSIMKQSPECYKYFQKIFIMPSRVTLKKLLTTH